MARKQWFESKGELRASTFLRRSYLHDQRTVATLIFASLEITPPAASLTGLVIYFSSVAGGSIQTSRLRTRYMTCAPTGRDAKCRTTKPNSLVARPTKAELNHLLCVEILE